MSRFANALALPVLLALAFSAAALAANPSLTREINFTLSEAGSVNCTGDAMRSLVINMSVPGNHSYQRVSMSANLSYDAEGNVFALITEDNPSNPFRFNITMNGTSSERTTRSLPPYYYVSDELLQYVSPSPKIQSDDAAIAATARMVVSGSRDDWEKIVRLTSYVHTYLTYDSSLAGQENNASWAFANQRGVCVEYAYLYAAMARSVGIPTRIVSGFAFSATQGWLGHAWAESYLGAWVPVDPTWLEAGHLDATHIQMSRTNGDFFETTAHAFISPGSQLLFSSNVADLGNTPGALNVSSMSESEPFDNEEAGLGASTIHVGDETIVYLKIRGTDYRAVGVTLIPCSSDNVTPVQVVDGANRTVALRPNETEVVVWRVKSDPSLPSGYLWTCPLTFNSNYLANKTIEMNLTPDTLARPSITAWLARTNVLLGDTQTVYYDVKTAPYGSTVGILTDSGVFRSPPRTGTQKFEFVPTEAGASRVFVFSSVGGLTELRFNVSRDISLLIKSVTLPLYIIQGKPFPVTVTIQNNASVPAGVSAVASVGSDAKTASAFFTGLQSINFSLVPPDAGSANVTVELVTDHAVDRLNRQIDVLPQPTASVTGVHYAFVGSSTTVQFNITGTGNHSLMNASIGNAKVPVQLGGISLSAEPGPATLALEWLDLAGNYYSSSVPIVIPSGAQTPEQTPDGDEGGGNPCPLLFILPLIFIAGKYALR